MADEPVRMSAGNERLPVLGENRQWEERLYISLCQQGPQKRARWWKQSTFNISYKFLLAIHFLSSLLPVLLNFWSNNPFIIAASNKKLSILATEWSQLFI